MPLSQFSDLPFQAVVAGMLSLLMASVVHLLLWRLRRETYLLLWGLAWIAFAARYVPMLWGTPFDARSSLSAIGTVRDVLFLSGAASFLGRRWWRWLIVPAAIEMVAILSGSLRDPLFGDVALGFRIASSAIAPLVVAAALFRSRRPGRGARAVSAVGVSLLAAMLFVGPIVVAEVSSLLAVLGQAGALVYVVGITFAELDEASALRLISLKKLEHTMQHALRGYANICADCGRIEAADGLWRAPETFIRGATNAPVTHGICPPCAKREFGVDIADATGPA